MNIYQEAISTFGEENQMIVAIEELSELQKEITKRLRYGKSNLEEEIADAKIVIAQLEEMSNKALVRINMEDKLHRLKGLIEKAKG